MTTIIGGSGSSGTTLLRTLLNRQKDIFSGPEMNLLNKRMLFDDWERNKTLIINRSRRLETGGWFPYPGTRVFDEPLGWRQPEIADLINEAKSLSEFVERLLSRPMHESGAQAWVEKTPSNAYCFSRFLDVSTAHKCIFMCRNPFDTVASLTNRGLSEYFAAGLWIYNSATAMQSIRSSRMMTLFYEDLLDDPAAELGRIFDFLSLDRRNVTLDASEDRALEQQHDRPAASFDQWRHDPRDSVRKSHSSTFERLSKPAQHRVISALNRVEVEIEGRAGYISGPEVARELGYDWHRELVCSRRRLQRQLLADFARRSGLRYASGFPNYPGRVR